MKTSPIIDHKCIENLAPHYIYKTEQFYKEDERCIETTQVLYEDGHQCSICNKIYLEE